MMNTIGVSFLDPLDDYEIIQKIGSGTYGDVFKVRITFCFYYSMECLSNDCNFNACCTVKISWRKHLSFWNTIKNLPQEIAWLVCIVLMYNDCITLYDTMVSIRT